MGIGDELFRNVVKALLTLHRLEKEGYSPTVSEFIRESEINHAVFYNHLKRNLERSGWVIFKVNPDRTITMHLTEKGRRVAEALSSIEKELREAGVV